jgi:hypothetical protein
MPVNYIDWITRDMLRAEPQARFVFGDNAARQGLGGQAKEMRGEPNAIGIATKWTPDMEHGAFFDDNVGAERSMSIMATDFSYVLQALEEGRTVYVPSGGLGTGLSRLPQVAPRHYAMLRGSFERVSEGPCPWEPAAQ